jgi:hypothetical protein
MLQYWDDERKFCTYKNEAKCGPLEPKKKEEEVDEASKVFYHFLKIL